MSYSSATATNFWHGKRVLITGHTGFKGAWLSWWLTKLGARVTGISLPVSTEPNLFMLLGLKNSMLHREGDIRDSSQIAQWLRQDQPEIVFHLAAQALVRASYAQPVDTFATNVMGTAHILDALRYASSCRVAVMVTTDKVYHNNEWHWPYREQDQLGGYDPYSASKAACEIVIDSYRRSFLDAQGIALASARAGNVIGGGDWSADRLIPDAIRSWTGGQTLEIRSPAAVRPWQHVLEPLRAYMTLASKLWDQPALAGPYNFGPSANDAADVGRVISLARERFGSGEVNLSQKQSDLHEARLLSLDVSKARNMLSISPRLNLVQSINMTMDWYSGFHRGETAAALCEHDLKTYGEWA